MTKILERKLIVTNRKLLKSWNLFKKYCSEFNDLLIERNKLIEQLKNDIK